MTPDPLQAISLIERDIKELRKDLAKLEKNIDAFKTQYSIDVTQNINGWNATTQNQSKLVWLFVTGIVGLILAAIGLQ